MTILDCQEAVEKKMVQVNFRMSEREYADLKECATACRLDVSDFVRDSVFIARPIILSMNKFPKRYFSLLNEMDDRQ